MEYLYKSPTDALHPDAHFHQHHAWKACLHARDLALLDQGVKSLIGLEGYPQIVLQNCSPILHNLIYLVLNLMFSFGTAATE